MNRYWSHEIGGGFASRLLAAIQIMLCIAPIALVLLVTHNLQQQERDLRRQLKLVAYLDDQLAAEQIDRLTAFVKGLDGYSSFEYRDRTEVFKEMQALIGAELLPGRMANPFPNVIEIRFTPEFSALANFESAAIQLKQFNFVQGVEFGALWLAAQERTFSTGARITLVLRVATLLAALLLLFWQARRLMVIHQEFMAAMRLLGARWRFVGLPVFSRTIGDAVIAGSLCLALLYGGCLLAREWSLRLSFFALDGMFTVLFITVVITIIGTALALRGAFR